MSIHIDRDTFYSLDDISQTFGLDPEVLEREARAMGGMLTAAKIGGVWLVRGDHLIVYLESYIMGGALVAQTPDPQASTRSRNITTGHDIDSSLIKSGDYHDPMSPNITPVADHATPHPAPPNATPQDSAVGQARGNADLVDDDGLLERPSQLMLRKNGASSDPAEPAAPLSEKMDSALPLEALPPTAEEAPKEYDPSSTAERLKVQFNIDQLVEEVEEIERQRERYEAGELPEEDNNMLDKSGANKWL